jgi:mersacidin/lichenicidin family type 2 lantibiotic
MSPNDIVRAWKDEEYLSNLNASDRAGMPEDPAGAIEISDRDLGDVSGSTTVPCSVIGTVIAFSALIGCASSIMHGTCSGWSYGCC